jgi:hypothetical protein
MDLMLLLDGSGSIDSGSWLKILQFTANIGLNFTTGHDFMKYGVVQFASVADTYMPLGSNNGTFQQTMQTMLQMDASTNTSGGVAVVEQEFAARGRPGAFKAMVILTDGMWNTGGSPLNITDRMKKNGIHIFTVAVGDANNDNVKALASKPLSKYFYNVTNEDQLPLILHKMIWNMCVRDPTLVGQFSLPTPATFDEHPPQPSQPFSATSQDVGNAFANDPAPVHHDLVEQDRIEDVQTVQNSYPSKIIAKAPFDCGGNSSGRWIQFTNKALNPIRINMCSLDFNKQVCKGGTPGGNATYITCDTTGANRGPDALTFIPANTSVALRLDVSVTYIVAIYCVDNPASVHCLSKPTALEFYGPTKEGGKPWPHEIAVPVAAAPFCSTDRDCVAPYTHCNATSSTPICA